jgi:hypothetical protein
MDGNAVVVLALFEMVVGPGLAVLYWAVRRTRLSLVTSFVAVAGAAAWWIDVWLVFATNVGDLSGIIDCYPYCSSSQEIASAFLFVPPIPMAVFIVAFVIAFAVGQVRSPRSTGSPASDG